MKVYSTTSEAYLGTLQDVYYNYEFRSAPRGLPVREKSDYTFRVLCPTNAPIKTHDPQRNDVIVDYTKKEVQLYDSCANTAEEFGRASKFWTTIANPDGTVNSAYGYLIWKNKSHGNPAYESGNRVLPNGSEKGYMRTPWEWAREALLSDKDTRQAILRFSLPEHAFKGVKDFTCTMHGNFLIRDNKLHLSVVMRSNDMMLGLVYDLPWFVSLMDKMIDELKHKYPELEKGHYTHTVHSAHIYERDEAKILKMLGK
jgi:thymidylate synthase